MDLLEKINLIKRLDNLIRRKATGTPKELSVKINISERQVYNIINEMKNMGAPIAFCQKTKTYYYKRSVSFKFGFLLEESSYEKINGGVSNSVYSFN